MGSMRGHLQWLRERMHLEEEFSGHCRCRVFCARERRVKRANEVRKGHQKFMAERIEARTHA